MSIKLSINKSLMSIKLSINILPQSLEKKFMLSQRYDLDTVS